MHTIIAFRAALAALLVLSFAGRLTAQKQAAAVKPPAVIEIGQPLAETVAVLRECGRTWGEGGFQISFGNNRDLANLFCDLDDQQASAIIVYSQSQRRVTGISIVFRPYDSAPRGEQSHLSAKGIRLEEDGSYAVRFSAPAKPDKQATQPKSVYPTSGGRSTPFNSR